MPMRMVFHLGLHEPVLFAGLAPSSFAEYVLACAAICALGVGSQWLKRRRERFERASLQAWDKRDAALSESEAEPSLGQRSPPDSPERLILGRPPLERQRTLALYTAAISAVDLGLMTAAMSLNVGYFGAAVVGSSLGVLFNA